VSHESARRRRSQHPPHGGALLQSDGFDTVEAPDGNAAMARLVEDAPDVVLLDLMMPPGPDGLATLEQIRRRAPHIPSS